MRNGTTWRAPLMRDFQSQTLVYGKLPLSTAQILDIELVLTLLCDYVPNADPDGAWAVLNGQPFAALTQLPIDARRAIAICRLRLPRHLGRGAWQGMFARYNTLSDPLPLYRLHNGHIERLDTPVVPERLDHMRRALRTSVPWQQRQPRYAPAGTYHFVVDHETFEVTIPQIDFEKTSSMPISIGEASRQPFEVMWRDLIATAQWMDSVAPPLSVAAQSWESRMRNIVLRRLDDGVIPTDVLTVAGILSLLGMVGAGKSTLLVVLTVFAARRGERVTIVQADVASLLSLHEIFAVFTAADPRIKAIPVIGRSGRLGHLNRLHASQARRTKQRAEKLASDMLLTPLQDQHPGYHVLSTICPLDGLRQDVAPIRQGQEPCTRLYQATLRPENNDFAANDPPRHRYDCPFMPVCPVHQGTRDLMNATVILTTPASLLLSGPQVPLISEEIRTVELVMRTSSLMLIDEADLVQVQFDDRFARLETLIGGQEPLLDKLYPQVVRQVYRAGRPDIGRSAALTRWLTAHTNTQQAADRLYGLLRSSGAIRDWLQASPFTGDRLFEGIATALQVRNIDTTPFTSAAQAFEQFPPTRIRSRQDGLTPPEAWTTAIQRELQAGDTSAALDLLRNWLTTTLPGITRLQSRQIEIVAERLLVALVVATLDLALQDLITDWDAVAGQLDLDQGSGGLFYTPSDDLARLIPEPPMGAILGFQYFDPDNNGNGELRFFQILAMGRELLYHLHDAFLLCDGVAGPNVILTSGTSVAPGSWRYDVRIRPGAILLPALPTTAEDTLCMFQAFTDPDHPARTLAVSGHDPRTRGLERYRNLRAIIAALARPNPLDGKSEFDREFDRLKLHRQRILLVVGSYDEAKVAGDMLLEVLGKAPGEEVEVIIPEREGEVGSVRPGRLQRSLLADIPSRPVRFVVAPLQAIERGHNIVVENGEAALGSVYFLVRPHPVPGDLRTALQRVNAWANDFVPTLSGSAAEAGAILRREAHLQWRKALNDATPYSRLQDPERAALLWTQLVMVWQCVGRLLRGGTNARVWFVDGAWARVSAGLSPETRENEATSMLVGFERVLAEAMTNPDPTQRAVIQQLYGPFLPALRNMINNMVR